MATSSLLYNISYQFLISSEFLFEINKISQKYLSSSCDGMHCCWVSDHWLITIRLVSPAVSRGVHGALYKAASHSGNNDWEQNSHQSFMVSSVRPDDSISRHSERLVQRRELSGGWQPRSSQPFKGSSQSLVGLELVEAWRGGSFPRLPLKHNLVQAWANYGPVLCSRFFVAKFGEIILVVNQL